MAHKKPAKTSKLAKRAHRPAPKAAVKAKRAVKIKATKALSKALNPARHLTPDVFVRVWQGSASIAEVVAKTGLTKSRASSRAMSYRKKGVQLQVFRSAKRMDWKALAEVAKKAARAS